MKQYHTVIIGAGPGGLACATVLAQSGVEVLVVERKETVGPKVCAGGIPHSTMQLGIPRRILERSFPTQHITTNWQQTSVKDKDPIICTVDRATLGQWMLSQAQEAGVTIKTGCHVTAIKEDRIVCQDGEYGYRFLIGADGSNSLVRRHLGIATRKVGIGVHYQIPMDYPKMEWHLNTKLFGSGYAWIFPHNGSASIGIYACHGQSKARALQQNLDDWAQEKGLSLNGHSPKAALINYDYRGWRFDNRFLIGDAAGLASGLTGEGIYSAIVSGQEAARTILNANHKCARMEQLIARQQRHTRMVELASKNSFSCTLLMEILVLGLRAGLLNFKALELGID